MPTQLRVSRLARIYLSEECVPVLGTAASGEGRSNAEHGDTSMSLSQVLLPQNRCSNAMRTGASLKEESRALFG
jgi:hypothetical protein